MSYFGGLLYFVLPPRLPQLPKTAPLLRSNVARQPRNPQKCSCRATDIFIQFRPDLDFLTDFSCKSPTSNFTQNRVNTEGPRDMTKLLCAFRDYANGPNTPYLLALQLHKGLVYVKLALSRHLDMAMCIPDGPRREKNCVLSRHWMRLS